MGIVKTLHFIKSTAGTHVFGEQGADRSEAVFPALYLPKRLFPNGAPATITVTVRI